MMLKPNRQKRCFFPDERAGMREVYTSSIGDIPEGPGQREVVPEYLIDSRLGSIGNLRGKRRKYK